MKKQVSLMCLWSACIIFSILILHLLISLFQAGFTALGFVIISVIVFGLGMYLDD